MSQLKNFYGLLYQSLQSVTKIIETHYIFIKKVHKNTLGLNLSIFQETSYISGGNSPKKKNSQNMSYISRNGTF